MVRSMPATSPNPGICCDRVLVESFGFSRYTIILSANIDHIYFCFLHASCWVHSFVDIISRHFLGSLTQPVFPLALEHIAISLPWEQMKQFLCLEAVDGK